MMVVPCNFTGEIVFFHEVKTYSIWWDPAPFSNLRKVASKVHPFLSVVQSPSSFGASSTSSHPKDGMPRLDSSSSLACLFSLNA
uniref:Uncharacterized protein n=1 Tax=Picea glauca TaxID=3330 RepID=A0A101LYY0_PICGL|nr:hypothetical protein ABT39_MTgene4859 [Picea glauca]QHR88642.1 hypothetical protein Q903MT_gene2656 [Picea sitchensis]